MGLNQIEKGLSRHHHLHLREELLPFGLLLGGGELVIREAELLATHHSSPGLRLQDYCPAMVLVFQSLPKTGSMSLGKENCHTHSSQILNQCAAS